MGTVWDVVGRTLRESAEAGLVRPERQRITLLDQAGLEAEAHRQDLICGHTPFAV